jgi:hypothetical protein
MGASSKGPRPFIPFFLFAVALPFISTAHTISFDDFSDVSSLTLNDNTVKAGNVLRLTSTATNQAGSAFTQTPVTLGPGGFFKTDFQFRISNPGGIGDADGVGADGIAFFMQDYGNMALGTAGGGFGYGGISNSLAVEFDTYNNGELAHDRHPARLPARSPHHLPPGEGRPGSCRARYLVGRDRGRAEGRARVAARGGEACRPAVDAGTAVWGEEWSRLKVLLAAMTRAK